MSLKTNRPGGQAWAAGNGEKRGASFVNHYSLLSSPIATGNLRQCYAALVDQAERRALIDPHPAHNRLLRYLTLRLARAILQEEGGHE